MSRGGRGGGRGGRGGRGGKNPYPWEEDKNLKVSYAPLEAFPHYNVPVPSAVTEREKAQVRSFLLFREQVHDGPLYTAARSYNAFTADAGSTMPRAYGQEQINQRYGKKDKGTIDPFTAMEMPSSRLKRVERALPDLAQRPFSTHLFPAELHATLNDEDHPGTGKATARNKKKTMTLSKVTTLRTAKEIFNVDGSNAETAEDRQKKVLEELTRLDETAGGEDEEDFDLDGQDYEEMDEVYDDEDGGDYDAEGYFDGGDDDDMDDGAGDDGVY